DMLLVHGAPVLQVPSGHRRVRGPLPGGQLHPMGVGRAGSPLGDRAVDHIVNLFVFGRVGPKSLRVERGTDDALAHRTVADDAVLRIEDGADRRRFDFAVGFGSVHAGNIIVKVPTKHDDDEPGEDRHRQISFTPHARDAPFRYTLHSITTAPAYLSIHWPTK